MVYRSPYDEICFDMIKKGKKVKRCILRENLLFTTRIDSSRIEIYDDPQGCNGKKDICNAVFINDKYMGHVDYDILEPEQYKKKRET